MKHFLSIMALAVIILSGCSSDSGSDNNAPSLFSANVINIQMESATIEWTPANDADGDLVTYAVYLSGQEIASNIPILSYAITGLQPETSYTGYVEARDGNGGTSRADFSFVTEPEVVVLIRSIVIKEFERPTTANCNGVNTALEIDAGVLVPKYTGNVNYTVQFGTLTFGWNNSTVAAVSRNWTNASFNSYYIYDYDANHYFVWQAGAGFSCSNNTSIPGVRANYATASGQATITIVRN